MEPHRTSTDVFTLINEGDFGSLDFHPADLPDLDWDISFDPNPIPCTEPETMNAAELDDDSWWYSDAYTPDSKYEEWFLTTRPWVIKSRSRRFRGIFNPKKKLAMDSNKLENYENGRDRCGDDDADDFRSLNSGSEPSQISSAASSVKSFNSLSREMSEDEEEITPTNSNQQLEKSPYVESEEHDILEIQHVKSGQDNSSSNESVHDTNGQDFTENEIENFATHDLDCGHERPSEDRYMAEHSYSVYKTSEDNCPNNPDVRKSDDSFMFPSTNPFQYRESNESLYSPVLGPFRKQTFDTSETGAEIINRFQLSSRGSISLKTCENPSIQLSPLNSGRLSFLSSNARVALSQENRYDRITYDVSESLLPENKCDMETASGEGLNSGQVTSECNLETPAENVRIPRMSTSSDQIPTRQTKRRNKTSRPTKLDSGYGKQRQAKKSDSIKTKKHVGVNPRRNSSIISKTEVTNKISSTAQIILNCNRSVQDSSVSSETTLNLDEEKFLESLSGTNPFVTNKGHIEGIKDTSSDDLIFFTPRTQPPNCPKSGIPVFKSAIPIHTVQKLNKDQILLPQKKLPEIQSKSKIPTPKPSPRNIKQAPTFIPKIKPRTWTVVPTPPRLPRRRFGYKPPEDILDDITDSSVRKDPSGYLQIHLVNFPKITSKTLEKPMSYQN